jgi:hypothetical protein
MHEARQAPFLVRQADGWVVCGRYVVLPDSCHHPRRPGGLE